MDPIEHLHRLPRHARGISLLEVLVAFAIMALALGVLLRIFGTGLRSSAAAERYSAATLWAESLMAGAGSTWPLDPGEEDGSLTGGYRYRRVVRPYDPGPVTGPLPRVPLVSIGVEVAWTEGEKTRRVVLSSLRLGPPEPVR